SADSLSTPAGPGLGLGGAVSAHRGQPQWVAKTLLYCPPTPLLTVGAACGETRFRCDGGRPGRTGLSGALPLGAPPPRAAGAGAGSGRRRRGRLGEHGPRRPPIGSKMPFRPRSGTMCCRIASAQLASALTRLAIAGLGATSQGSPLRPGGREAGRPLRRPAG